MTWKGRREWIYGEIAEAFASRTGIGMVDFLKIYIEGDEPPSVGDFETQYIPDRETLDDILDALGEATGTGSKARSHYDRRESFVQFAEHLLRAGAHEREEEE
jgi:hypothetical protein